MLRQAASKAGHTHHIAKLPAERASAPVTAGVPVRLMPYLDPNGVRVRRSCKTKPAIGKLRYIPKKYVYCQDGLSRRVMVKSRVIRYVPVLRCRPEVHEKAPKRRRLYSKTSAEDTVYVALHG